MRPRTVTLTALLATAALAVVAACSGGDGAQPAPSSSTTTSGPTSTSDGRGAGPMVLSSRPDMVTGGDALVRAPDGATLTLDGRRATTAPGPVPGTVLVTGIPDGPATLAAAGRRVTVVGHPSTGPVFSGPHAPLYGCTTDRFGLGKATDADCSARTEVDRLTVGDTAATRERGVINRSVYWIVVPDSGWNGRLVYRFGGGCGTSFGQGTPLTRAEDPDLLAAGYAVATATFNTFQVQCNDVLSAETMMMVKERFIEAHGPPRFTIGEGASGGSIQQHLILQNYPGLLDAAAAELPFPDAITIAPGVTDCGLLSRYFAGAGRTLSATQRLAVSGFGSPGTCSFWEASFLSGIRPADGCDPAVPEADISTPRPTPRGCAAPSSTPTPTPSGETRPPGSPGGPSTTSASSTAARPCSPGPSTSTSSSTSTPGSAATTPTAARCPPAPRRTRPRWRRPTPRGASPRAGAPSPPRHWSM